MGGNYTIAMRAPRRHRKSGHDARRQQQQQQEAHDCGRAKGALGGQSNSSD